MEFDTTCFVKERSLTSIQMMRVHIKEMSHLVLSIGEGGLESEQAPAHV